MKRARRQAHCSGAKAHARAFFSFDAAMAMVLAVFSFVSLAAIGQSSALFAESDSLEISGANLALRLSTYVLGEDGAQTGGGNEFISATYVLPGVLDLEKLPAVPQGLLAKSGRDYVSVSVEGNSFPRRESEAGSRSSKTYCAKRLALAGLPPDFGKEPVLLEVCVG